MKSCCINGESKAMISTGPIPNCNDQIPTFKKLENSISLSPRNVRRPATATIGADLQLVVGTMRPRSRSHTTSRSSSKSPTSQRRARHELFTEQHKSLLRHSWDHVGKHGCGGIGAMIFRRVFDRCPSVRRMFDFGTCSVANLQYNTHFQWHARKFVNVIDGAIRSLDRSSEGEYGAELLEHGRHHAQLADRGFEADYWEIFAEAMTESATEWIGPGKHRETVRAWTILVSHIVDRMRSGYEDEVKRRKRAAAPQYLELNYDVRSTVKRTKSVCPLLTTNGCPCTSGRVSPSVFVGSDS